MQEASRITRLQHIVLPELIEHHVYGSIEGLMEETSSTHLAFSIPTVLPDGTPMSHSRTPLALIPRLHPRTPLDVPQYQGI